MNSGMLFQRLDKIPGGKRLFSWAVCRKAPYFSSIHPYVSKLSNSQCVVAVKKRKSVLNHIGTIHAIALCNACELAFGLLMESGVLPSNLRWIPKGMTTRYLKKAETDIKAVATISEGFTFTPGDHVISVTVDSLDGVRVMEADITVYISEKPKKG